MSPVVGLGPLVAGTLGKHLIPPQLANFLFCLFGNCDQLVVFTKRGTDLRVTCFAENAPTCLVVACDS